MDVVALYISVVHIEVVIFIFNHFCVLSILLALFVVERDVVSRSEVVV